MSRYRVSREIRRSAPIWLSLCGLILLGIGAWGLLVSFAASAAYPSEVDDTRTVAPSPTQEVAPESVRFELRSPTPTPEPPTLEPSPEPSSTPAPTATETPSPEPSPTLLLTATGTATAEPSLTPTETLPPVPPASPAAPDALEPLLPAQPAAAYEVYIPTASKGGQYFKYTCEFDASWVIFKSYGLEVSLDDQLAVLGRDMSLEPTYAATADGNMIYGGDIRNYWSGDYENNFMARTTGSAMRKVFQHYGLRATPVHDQLSLVEALHAGSLAWIKTTVDFKDWKPATWVLPDGSTLKTVLGNDHAVVVMGYNAGSVLIRDVLGPTSTNATRPYEYEVSWPTFLAAWGAQEYDGLAVAPPYVAQ